MYLYDLGLKSIIIILRTITPIYYLIYLPTYYMYMARVCVYFLKLGDHY